ncbi:hypothetical protein HA402_004872 [Bradysia odoriphaga]|nr:hypothetical protein HA402_004872 [Bradysia odoriphaga]
MLCLESSATHNNIGIDVQQVPTNAMQGARHLKTAMDSTEDITMQERAEYLQIPTMIENEIQKVGLKEPQQLAPSLFNDVKDTLKRIYRDYNQNMNFTRIAYCLANKKTCTTEEAKEMLNNCGDVSFVTENKDNLLKALTQSSGSSSKSSLIIKLYDDFEQIIPENFLKMLPFPNTNQYDDDMHHIRCKMQEVARRTADTILVFGILSSGACVVLEVVKVYRFWQSIRRARGLIEQSPGHRDRISKNLDAIRPKISELDKAVAALRGDSMDENSFKLAQITAQGCINDIRSLIDNALQDINYLHVEINGVKESLMVSRGTVLRSTVNSSMSILSSLSNVFALNSAAHSILLNTQMCVAAIQFITVAADIHMYITSGKQLDHLRNELEGIDKLKDAGNEIQKHVNRTAQEILELALNRLVNLG